MNNKKKESSSPWVLRLFRQSKASAATQRKIYYAHRYDADFTDQRNPFGELFSGTGIHQAEIADLSDGHRRCESPFPPAKSEPEFFQSVDSIPSPALHDKVYPPGNASIGPRLTVVNRYDETPDTKTFRLAAQAERFFDYQPGQYIILSIDIGGREYKRSYSLASSPSRPRLLEITVKRAPNGGIVSNWLNDNLQVGDTLAVKGPFGKFGCVPDTPRENPVFGRRQRHRPDHVDAALACRYRRARRH
ncbi:MAG: FAD-binding oxidoreductase [Gammaproteobacteria bacterium]